MDYRQILTKASIEYLKELFYIVLRKFHSIYMYIYNFTSFDLLIDEITASFRRFGPLVVDWPHKAESKSYFPPKGYAFLLFQVNINLIKEKC